MNKRVRNMLAMVMVMAATLAAPALAENQAAPAADQERQMFEAVRPGEYLLGASDVLQIMVWGDETLSPQVVIRPDGKISLPLIGDVQAGGRTVEDLRSEVERRLREYVSDSPVSLMVVEVNSPKIYVLGKVNKPGVYIMSHPMTVSQALTMAAGFNPFAETDNVLLVRGIGANQKTYEFDYDDVSRGKEMHTNIQVQPNDTIIVP